MVSSVLSYGQNVFLLTYDSATIVNINKEIEVAVNTKVMFDPTGFSLFSSDKIHTYLVTGSEFHPLPTRRFYDTGHDLKPKKGDTTNTVKVVYGIVGYEYLQVIVIMGDNIEKTLPILKKDGTGIILH